MELSRALKRIAAPAIALASTACGPAVPAHLTPAPKPENVSPRLCLVPDGPQFETRGMLVIPRPGPGSAAAAGPAGGETEVWVRRPDHGRSLEAGIVFVTGVDGGFIQPADGVYGRVASRMAARGVGSIFVKYRAPGELESSVEDALTAARLLRDQGAKRIVLMGWSFGGAVVLHTAARLEKMFGTGRDGPLGMVVAFAPQARDTEIGSELAALPRLLLFHSRDDENVPYDASLEILSSTNAVQKHLVSFDGVDHSLTGARLPVDTVLNRWLDQVFPDAGC